MQKNAEIFFLPRFSQFLFQISIPNYHVELSHCAISNFSFSFFLLSKLVFVPGERFNCKLLIPFFFSFFFWKRTRTLVCSLRPRYETTTKINLKTINLFRSPCVTRSPGIPLTLLNVRNVWTKLGWISQTLICSLVQRNSTRVDTLVSSPNLVKVNQQKLRCCRA